MKYVIILLVFAFLCTQAVPAQDSKNDDLKPTEMFLNQLDEALKHPQKSDEKYLDLAIKLLDAEIQHIEAKILKQVEEICKIAKKVLEATGFW